MGFEILMNGVGDAFSREHFGTNFLLRRGDYVLAVDCPDSYRRALADHGFEHQGRVLDAEDINDMILTHLHGDHVNGLEMVAAYRRFVKGGILTLHTSPDVAQVLWPRRLAVSLGTMWTGEEYETMGQSDFLNMHLIPWQETTQIGPFEVITRRTIHHIPTMALRVSDGTHTLGYSCDTAYDEDLIDWLRDCDLIIHESTLGKAHTPLFKLLELPEELREKMLVVHYPDDLLGMEIEGIRLAKEGAIYQVG